MVLVSLLAGLVPLVLTLEVAPSMQVAEKQALMLDMRQMLPPRLRRWTQ